MSAISVVANNLEFNFVADAPPRLGERWWAMAIAQARDEITDEPLQSALTIIVHRQGVLSKAGADGTFCLVGRPWLRFPPLLAPVTQIEVTVEAQGYLPYRHAFDVQFDQRVIVAPAPLSGTSMMKLNAVTGLAAGDTLLLGPAGANREYAQIATINAATNEVTIAGRLLHNHVVGAFVYSDNFAPAPMVDLHLRHVPLVINGRVVRRNTALNTTAPVAAASIAVTDFWRTQQAVRTHQPGAMTNVNPALRSFAIALASAVSVERVAGATFAGSMPLPGTPAMVKHVMAAADEGSRRVTLSDRIGLAIGGIVQLDVDPERAEFQTITGVPALGGLNEPARVDLALPLVYAHETGAPVERINAAAPTPAPRAFKDGAKAGDRTIFVDSPAGLASQGTLRITDGVAPDEYHAFARYETQSDSDGYFRLPPLHRVAQVHITATAGADVQEADLQPRYGDAEHRLDIVFVV
ncbi:MAG: hypothetical protein JWN94_4346 [Betaproteobacteria bacterium]|nr:hypothetical protein [Betaproteobacteria bacterium]